LCYVLLSRGTRKRIEEAIAWLPNQRLPQAGTHSPSQFHPPLSRSHVTGSTQRITIKGVKGRPLIFGKACQRKAAIITNAMQWTIIDNIEVAQVTVSSSDGGNGAAIRHQGLNLYVRNCYFHDGDEGILTNSMGLAPGKNGAAVG